MKFQLVINMERLTPDTNMADVARHTTEMVQMADEGGFEIAWVAEHHAIEMTIAPGPFQLLAHWGAHTEQIRLGTAVVVAPYWHPLKLAGEVGMIDLLTGGRFEFGIGKGGIPARVRPHGQRHGPEHGRAHDAGDAARPQRPVARRLRA